MTRTPAAATAAPEDKTAQLSAFAEGLAAYGKDWRKSLTLQGIAISTVAAPFVAHYTAGLLTPFGVDPTQAADVAKGLSTLLVDLGGVMALIGRVRLGGLK